MQNLSIRRPSDVTDFVRRIMGFEPTESIVFVGVGTAPTARLDALDLATVVEAFSAVATNWMENGIVAVLYSDALGENYLSAVTDALGVPVVLSGVVTGDTVTVGGRTDPYVPDGRTRENLITDVADAVHNADEADEEALRAYKAGNGALAWAYLDRAKELRGKASAMGKALSELLADAVDPRG